MDITFNFPTEFNFQTEVKQSNLESMQSKNGQGLVETNTEET